MPFRRGVRRPPRLAVASPFFVLFVSSWFLAVAVPVPADDWPTYKHDARRSAVSSESLPTASLHEAWVYSSKMPVRGAWPGPAPRDMYNAPTVDNEDRLDLDSVYHVAAVGDDVFLPSSGEDSLRCLDARTGETRWVFTADGPVRFAPHVVAGRVYFGSDDGHIYCVSASDGALLWRRNPLPAQHVLPSDGKLVSLWPNRTGVIVVDGIVYFGVGVFPAEGVHVCALDAEDGSDVTSQRHTDMSLQGYILASVGHLYIPGGRAGPWVFDRETGERKGQVGGGGGTYAVVTPEDSLIYGPGQTSAVLEEFAGETRDRLASFPGARQIVVTPRRTYIATRSELFSLDRARWIELGSELAALAAKLKELDAESPEHAATQAKAKQLEEQREACEKWRRKSHLSEGLILAGDTLIAGGHWRVAAYRASDGEQTWIHDVDGRAKGLAVAGGRLFVSTDTRKVYCFTN